MKTILQKVSAGISAGISVVLLAACSPGNEQGFNAHDISGLMPELAYTLENQDGETATAQDHAGQTRLLFFGFTHCPDICPVTLGRLRSAIAALPENLREQVTVLFVSVDPKRDTPETLASYTGHFGSQVIGMTGSQEQLKKLTRRYRVTYGYGEPDDSGFYNVSHSSGVFVFDEDGKARLLINQEQTAAQIAQDLQRLMQ